jgi:hypothetical protein
VPQVLGAPKVLASALLVPGTPGKFSKLAILVPCTLVTLSALRSKVLVPALVIQNLGNLAVFLVLLYSGMVI